ncbi:MAG: two-component regulator propeller domain-containing protein [Acidobacteriota bacterium]
MQDSRGFIWIATEDGVNKYDGYEFINYKPDSNNKNSISHNYIWKVMEDSKGKIWIGTNGGGVNRFDPIKQNFIHFKNDVDNSESLSSNFVWDIYEDSKGIIWVGTLGGGLNKLQWDEKTGEPFFIRFQNTVNGPNRISGNNVASIYEDSKGNLWVGTNNGLNKIELNSDKIYEFKHDPSDPDSLSDSSIIEVYEDNEGILWVGTNYGLNRFNRETGNFKRIFFGKNKNPGSRENRIWAIQGVNSEKLLVGTDGGLIVLYKKNGKSDLYKRCETEGCISHNEIRSLLVDRSGIIWIGTEGGGICRYSPNKQKFRSYKRELQNYKNFDNRIIWSILEDRSGLIWMGTNGGGMISLDRRSGVHKFYKNNNSDPDSLSDNVVKSICEDDSGILWIGTETGGLNRFDPSTGKFIHFMNDPSDPESLGNDHVRKIIMGNRGYLWMATAGGGLNRFDRKTNKFKRYINDPDNPDSIRHHNLYTVFEDKKGILWIGTWGRGLIKFLKEEEKFIYYNQDYEDPSSLSHDLVVSFCEDKKGNFWIGTSGGGLNKFNRENETFLRFGEKEGLINGVVYGILEGENGNLWMSTNKGIIRFDPETNLFKNYTKEDGLESNEFNGNSWFKNEKTGEMFFGGIEGFNTFFPQNINDNKFVPPVVLTSFYKFNKKIFPEKHISEMKEIELTYRDYFFSFEFAVLDFTAPKKNKYAYKLEGLDEQWIYTDSSKRIASYTTLSPGRYTLRVIGSNSDGLWNEKGASIDIIISPPFWKTLWFKSLIFILLVAASFAAHRIRIRMIEKRLKNEAEMERMLLKRGISEREREIVILILNGNTSRDIEDSLFISYGTVKNHIYSIYKKLNIKNRAELVNLFKDINSNNL